MIVFVFNERQTGASVDTNPFSQRVTTKDFKDDGSFKVVFDEPVVAGQFVIACAADERMAHAADNCGQAETVLSVGDWGRVRSYFAGGVVFSKGHNDFSQQDLMMAFTLDKKWAQRHTGVVRAFNTFFDTRLTSVPVGSATTTTTDTKGTGAAATTISTTDQFIGSRKAAVMQGGFYIPMFGGPQIWTYQNQKNAVFFAPVFKAGVVTTASDAATTTTSSAASTSTTTTSTSHPSGVFTFYSLGFGVGHERLTQHKDSAPELISYFHMTFGKWNNFDPDRLRMGLEGRLKIPESLLQVGFDANVPCRGGGPSDFRFVVGARFDLGELVGKLKLVGGQ